MDHHDGVMTSTFASPAVRSGPALPSARVPEHTWDLGPRSGNARERSRVPGQPAQHRARSDEHQPSEHAEGAHSTGALHGCALWVGSDGPLRDQAVDHATASGLELLDAGDAPPGLVTVVLTDAGALAARAVPRIPGAVLLVLVPEGPIAPELWSTALEHGARAVLQLPSQSSALLSHLAQAARPLTRALMIGVVGGCGGAGASSLAARLAGAARSHGEVLLVDADPVGGGLDLLVEAPEASGIGWQDVVTVDASDGEALRQALPVVDGVRLLVAGDGPGPDGPLLQRALQAVEAGGGTVVVDLAASLVPAAAPLLDQLLVVVPCTDHAVRATARRLRAWALPAGQATVAIRRRGDLTPAEVASDLQLRPAMSFRDSPAGVVPLLDMRRRGADRSCRTYLADLLPTAQQPRRGGQRR